MAVSAVVASLALTNLKAKTEAAIHTKVQESVAIAKTPVKPDALDAWIHKLMMQESGGRTTFVENGGLPYIIDVNGKRSYSCLQFQQGTFDSYAKKHGITGSITDCKVQKKLVRAMIKDNRNNWRHWFNSVSKFGVGYPPQS